MFLDDFYKDYLIIRRNDGEEQFQKQQPAIHQISKITKQSSTETEYLISVHYENLDEISLTIETQISWHTLTKVSLFKKQRAHPNIQELPKIWTQKQGNRILLQLALTFAELQRRKYRWLLQKIENLYYMEGLLFLSLADCDIDSINNAPSCFETFKQFVKSHFCRFFPEINDYLNRETFEPIIEYLIQKEVKQDKMFNLNPPYEDVLKYLLEIKDLCVIYRCANSVVKSFKTPQQFYFCFPTLENMIVYKSTKNDIKDRQEEKSINIQREIELMEEFDENSKIAVYFAYFRIGQYSFLLLKKYSGTLANVLTKWKPIEDKLKINVYCFCQKFAEALKNMHQQKVIHRDLKPDNLFLDNDHFDYGDVYIADLDRSKQLQQESNMVQAKEANSFLTDLYNPPEQANSVQYDVFQYGLICYSVANKGQYVGIEAGPRRMDNSQFGKFYSFQAINEKLKQFYYDQKFIKILWRCLDKDPSNRPSAGDIYAIMNNLVQKERTGSADKSPQLEQTPPQQNPPPYSSPPIQKQPQQRPKTISYISVQPKQQLDQPSPSLQQNPRVSQQQPQQQHDQQQQQQVSKHPSSMTNIYTQPQQFSKEYQEYLSSKIKVVQPSNSTLSNDESQQKQQQSMADYPQNTQYQNCKLKILSISLQSQPQQQQQQIEQSPINQSNPNRLSVQNNDSPTPKNKTIIRQPSSSNIRLIGAREKKDQN